MDRELDLDKNRTGVALRDPESRASRQPHRQWEGMRSNSLFVYSLVCVTWIKIPSPRREDLIVLTGIKCVPESTRKGQDSHL